MRADVEGCGLVALATRCQPLEVGEASREEADLLVRWWRPVTKDGQLTEVQAKGLQVLYEGSVREVSETLTDGRGAGAYRREILLPYRGEVAVEQAVRLLLLQRLLLLLLLRLRGVVLVVTVALMVHLARAVAGSSYAMTR